MTGSIINARQLETTANVFRLLYKKHLGSEERQNYVDWRPDPQLDRDVAIAFAIERLDAGHPVSLREVNDWRRDIDGLIEARTSARRLLSEMAIVYGPAADGCAERAELCWMCEAVDSSLQRAQRLRACLTVAEGLERL